MEASYRERLGSLQFTDEEIDVVVKSTITLLRRHNVEGTLCSRCRNDDPEACRVTKIDGLGFIIEVECQGCAREPGTEAVDQVPVFNPQREQSAICRRTLCRYESIDDPSTLRPGDHVTWHRPYLIWHHAVVTEQDHDNREITVHEYTLGHDGPYAAFVKTKMSYAKSVYSNFNRDLRFLSLEISLM